jgi:5'-nucleotidase
MKYERPFFPIRTIDYMLITYRPLILLTNDDGIASPGLHAAAEALAAIGDLLVAAPAHQQTAMGRSHTGRQGALLECVDLKILGQTVAAYGLDASPATVVRHTLQALCQERTPNLVVSGINYGENVGTTITVSGTVGAAFEGAVHGIPALAVSLQMDFSKIHHHGDEDWRAAAHFVRLFALRLLERRLPFDVDVLKVDVPECATPDTPWRLTRLSRQHYVEVILDEPHPGSRLGDGRVTVRVDETTLESDSDIHALVRDRVVSVTPLSLDSTSRTRFGDIQAFLEP